MDPDTSAIKSVIALQYNLILGSCSTSTPTPSYPRHHPYCRCG